MAAESFTGTVERVVYQNEDNGYTVARLAPQEKTLITDTVTVVGHMQNVHAGEVIKVQGFWKDHPRFGRQYQVQSFEALKPTTVEGVTHYLASGLIPGVGPLLAERIVDKFGDQTLDILDHDFDRLLQVPGIGRKKLAAMKVVWETVMSSRSVFMFLQQLGISPLMAQKIFKHYGAETRLLIQENPYQLAHDIWGIGFMKADAAAKRLGHKADSHFRVRAGLRHVLSRAVEDGHVFLPRPKLVDQARALLEVDEALVVYTLDDEIQTQELMDEEGRVYLRPLYYTEKGVANLLLQLQADSTSKDQTGSVDQILAQFEQRKGIWFHALQKQAITKAVTEKVMVITGGPGTGKTTVLLGILHYARSKGKQVLLAAPTGRAAKRMEEVTGHKAKTIHRLLEYQPRSGFMRHAERPLECDILVVDEVSMVDISLMYSLLKAMPRYASLVLIGDNNQLPSVGAGQVLKDLIASGSICVVRLTEIFRQVQQSSIVTSAHAVYQGRMPVLASQPNTDFYFVEENDAAQAANLVCGMVVERLPQKFGFDAVRDIQVLVPMRRGSCGSEQLNAMLQSKLQNQRLVDPTLARPRMFAGDKVMQIKNNYEKQVFNGDIGVVQTLDPTSGLMAVHFDGNLVEYPQWERDEIVLAYAITVHKSQGNEYPAVVLPILTQHYVMLYRNLLYTAITRAKKCLVVVGSKKAVVMAVKNADPHERNSYLQERLRCG